MPDTKRKQQKGSTKEARSYNLIYQLPLILTALFHLPDKRCLSHGMCLHQIMMTDKSQLSDHKRSLF